MFRLLVSLIISFFFFLQISFGIDFCVTMRCDEHSKWNYQMVSTELFSHRFSEITLLRIWQSKQSHRETHTQTATNDERINDVFLCQELTQNWMRQSIRTPFTRSKGNIIHTKKNLLWLNSIVSLPESVLVFMLFCRWPCSGEAQEPNHYILDQQQQVTNTSLHTCTHTLTACHTYIHTRIALTPYMLASKQNDKTKIITKNATLLHGTVFNVVRAMCVCVCVFVDYMAHKGE